MKISNIKVTITEKDLYSIVNDVLKDYVEVDGLNIDKILIDEQIHIIGSYKHKVTIPFSVYVSIKKVEKNILYLTIDKVNVKNLKIFSGLIKMVLKAIGGKVKELGIEFEGELVKLNFDKLCKVIPMVDFKLESLKVVPYGLEAEVSDFSFINQEKEDGKEEKTIEKKEAVKDNGEVHREDSKVNNEEKSNVKKSNEYTYRRFRKEFEGKMSDKYKKFYPYIVMIPDVLALFMRLYKDERVTKETKANISIALGYLLFPLDIIPDTIPIVGKIDDLAVTFYILEKVLCDIPKEIVIENWEGKENIIQVSSEAITLLNDKFGTAEIKKIIDIVRLASKRVVVFFTK